MRTLDVEKVTIVRTERKEEKKKRRGRGRRDRNGKVNDWKLVV